MKADLARREPEHGRALARRRHLQAVAPPRRRPAEVRAVDGPPYANGAIHIGHAVNKVLKDIIVKSRALDGYDSPYVPGWDCHGLPVEQQVEKKHGRVGQKLDADTFRKACREFAASQVALQKVDFQRLGNNSSDALFMWCPFGEPSYVLLSIVAWAFNLKLSPMTAVGGPLVIAACTEFTSLILLRFVEERGRGYEPREAIDVTASRTGRAFIVSALTAIAGVAVLRSRRCRCCATSAGSSR